MLASNGEMGEPCGVPVSTSETTPPSKIPARSHARSSLTTSRSHTRRSTTAPGRRGRCGQSRLRCRRRAPTRLPRSPRHARRPEPGVRCVAGETRNCTPGTGSRRSAPRLAWPRSSRHGRGPWGYPAAGWLPACRAWGCTPAAAATDDTCASAAPRRVPQERLHPGRLNVVDGHIVDAGHAAVGTNLDPRPRQHVAAGDLVIQGVEPTLGLLLGAAVQHALEGSNRIHTIGVSGGPSRHCGTHQGASLPTSCIGEVGTLPSPTVVLSAGSPVPRPPPTPCMATTPLPGSAGYRRGIASRPPQRRGHPRPPQLAGRLSDRSTPLTPKGSSTSASGPTTSSMAFTATESAWHPLGRLTAGDITTLAQASLLVADRSVAPPRCDDCGLTTRRRGLPTRDPDVSPGRTCTGKPSCPYGSVTSS